MGCLHCGRQVTGRKPQVNAAVGVDIVITQTHASRDARTTALVTWLVGVCRQGGISAFFDEGVSASPCLKTSERRRLRTAFDNANCVLAAVVSHALDESGLQLTNEVMWAEQHGKPIVILYDSALPFKRHDWEEKWPDIFRCGSVFRYYGKGHETCRRELLDVLEGILHPSSKKIPAMQQSKMSNHVSAESSAPSKETREEEHMLENKETLELLSLDAALEILRAMQSSDPLVAQGGDSGVRKAGILRQKVGSIATPAVRCKTPFRPTEQNVQHAVKSIASLMNGPGVDIHVAADCLSASIAVSEYSICASLRALSAQIVLSHPGVDDLNDILDSALLAMRHHINSADVCTSVLQMLATSANSLPRGWPSVREATDIANALRSFPSCQALHEFGFAFIAEVMGQEKLPVDSEGMEKSSAFAIRGGGLARILTRLGVVDVALTSLQRYREVSGLVVNICVVLNGLADASREVKLYLAASDIWVDILTHAPLDAGGAMAALRTLAWIVTDDIDAKDAMGERVSLLDTLERRLFNLSTAVDVISMEEYGEIFGFLCRLTARHTFNKNRCLKSELPRQAVECCMDRSKSDAARLASGGFLVNLCGEKSSRQELLAVGATRAAAVLQIASADLNRCGKLLETNLNSSDVDVEEEHAAQKRSAFDGLFAVRGGNLRGISNALEVSKKSSNKPPKEQRCEKTVGDVRGPGWQRRPPKQLGSVSPKLEASVQDFRDDITIMSQRSSTSKETERSAEEFELERPEKQELDHGRDSRPDNLSPFGTQSDKMAPGLHVSQNYENRSDSYIQNRGLKGNSDMKSRLANIRKQIKSEELEADSKHKGVFSRFGRRSESSSVDQDAPEPYSFRPEDRQRDEHVAKLAVAASAIG